MKVLARCALGVAVIAAGTLWADDQSSLIPPGAMDQPVGYENPEKKDLPIEICFVLDTTGSMGGFIQSAKDKIWSVANDILKESPKSTIKMGLVAYRDRRDVYVTQVSDLTDDLDAFYKELMALQAKSGGDRPESVNQALREAVEKMSWNKTPTIRLIFLVGDSPPHMDYPDDVQYPETLAKASQLAIYVNAVQCGTHPDTTTIWKEIAVRGGGVYFAIGAGTETEAVVRTPQDKKLIELNASLAQTVVPYGTTDQQAAVAAKAVSYKDMPLEAAAARVSVNSLMGGKALQGKGDLVQDMQSDKDLVARLKPEELPANMQKMTLEERQKFLDTQLARRQTINNQIASVTKERDAVLASAVTDSLRTDPAAAGLARRGAAGMGGGAGGGMGGMGGGGFSGAVRGGVGARGGRGS